MGGSKCADAEVEANAEVEDADATDVHMEPRNCGRQLDSNRRMYGKNENTDMDVDTDADDGKKHIYFSYRDTDADADTDMDTDMDTDTDTDTEESRQWFGACCDSGSGCVYNEEWKAINGSHGGIALEQQGHMMCLHAEADADAEAEAEAKADAEAAEVDQTHLPGAC
ncbi:hypothetical protein K438DRAFT_1776886 [Mycena galopus ATCC 62051]|nr:hypothetical protein K438DRAFT_1776886 [Mycena galopus ATCC 62051]